MAIMKALFAASVLASLASAIPMPGPRMDKRAVAVNTVTHTTWTTVDITTTVYVNDADPTPPPQAPASSEAVPTSAPAPPAPPVPETPASSPAVSPANFAQDQPTPAAYTPPASSAAPAPAPESTVNVAPKNSGGQCEGQGSGCSGDITYYNGAGGLGSCGTVIDDNANIVALPVGLMGSVSNGNPYCGRTVHIKGTDGSIHTGTVADKCMGCSGMSIDLTPALFKAVAPNGDGRVSNIDWWF